MLYLEGLSQSGVRVVGGLFTLGFAGGRRSVQSGVRVVEAYLEGDLRVVGTAAGS